MKYEIKKVVSYVVFDEEGDIVNEFTDYDKAYRWIQKIKKEGGIDEN